MSRVQIQQDCSVAVSGEIVVATFGNVRFNLDHETALGIATDLRMVARAVKTAHDDRSRTWRVHGMLHDANARKPATLIDGGVAKRGNYEVTSDGFVVSLRIERTAIGMGYADALKLAGWFRINAKAASNIAGDSRHWSDVVDVGESAGRAADLVR